MPTRTSGKQDVGMVIVTAIWMRRDRSIFNSVCGSIGKGLGPYPEKQVSGEENVPHTAAVLPEMCSSMGVCKHRESSISFRLRDKPVEMAPWQ